MSTGKALTPDDILKLKAENIPEYVFDAFNHVIAKHFDGVSASFEKREAVSEILVRAARVGQNTVDEDVYAQHLLDVESAYREMGWEVTYNKPRFVFKRRK